VNRDIKPGWIAVGIPCTEIKEREKDYLELEKKFLKEAGY
jgi:acetyltransferase-like isoleucine patch superfamily enzyme